MEPGPFFLFWFALAFVGGFVTGNAQSKARSTESEEEIRAAARRSATGSALIAAGFSGFVSCFLTVLLSAPFVDDKQFGFVLALVHLALVPALGTMAWRLRSSLLAKVERGGLEIRVHAELDSDEANRKPGAFSGELKVRKGRVLAYSLPSLRASRRQEKKTGRTVLAIIVAFGVVILTTMSIDGKAWCLTIPFGVLFFGVAALLWHQNRSSARPPRDFAIEASHATAFPGDRVTFRVTAPPLAGCSRLRATLLVLRLRQQGRQVLQELAEVHPLATQPHDGSEFWRGELALPSQVLGSMEVFQSPTRRYLILFGFAGAGMSPVADGVELPLGLRPTHTAEGAAPPDDPPPA